MGCSQWSNVHINAYCNYKARDNFGLANLREIFTAELIDEGHEVIKINTTGCEVLLQTKEFMEGETEQGKAIHRETASAIANSDEITLEAAQAIMRKATATATERHQATKAFISEEIPGVELTPEFIEKNVVRDRRRSLNAIKLYWKLLHPDAAQYYDEKEYSHKFRQFATHSIVYLPDIRAYYPLVKELLDLGILEVLANPDKEYTQDDSWLEEFKQKCLRRRNRLYQLFDIIVTKKSKAVHLLNRFLDKIGLGFICEQKRIDGERVRTYKLDPEKLNNSDRFAILNAFSFKWEQTKTRHGLEGVTELAQTSYTNNQTETSVTVEHNEVTSNVARAENDRITRTGDWGETVPNQLENETVQTQFPQSLEGVKELSRTSYTDNQEETSVTDENPFWWPRYCDRYDPEIEVAAYIGYASLLAAESFRELQEAKEQIIELSQNLGWGSHQLLNWLFERIPDDAIDYVEELMAM